MVDAALFGELQTLCKGSFPQRVDQSITQIKPLRDGRNPTVSFSLAWREGKRMRVERLIVRHHADRWTWWSVDDGQKTQREWTVMRWLFGRGLPVPQPYASGTEGKHEYLLIQNVAGTHASATNEAHIEALAALLAQIHCLAAPEDVRLVLPEASIETELARLRDMAYRSSAHGVLDATAELYRQMEAESEQNKKEVPPLCVLHGDPTFANVRCDAQGITALLGWENAALGDPRWDVARVVNNLRSNGNDTLAERFCTVYQDRGGQPPADLTYWETLTATQSWMLTEWANAYKSAQATQKDTGRLATDQKAWQERAWRSLTRLRYEQDVKRET